MFTTCLNRKVLRQKTQKTFLKRKVLRRQTTIPLPKNRAGDTTLRVTGATRKTRNKEKKEIIFVFDHRMQASNPDPKNLVLKTRRQTYTL
jgi:hypothetical protein